MTLRVIVVPDIIFFCFCKPRCQLQILISPNPSLATKSALLPWSGQIYVQCDGQQKVRPHARLGLRQTGLMDDCLLIDERIVR